MSISFQVGQLAGLHNKIDVNLLHVIIIVTNPDSIITATTMSSSKNQQNRYNTDDTQAPDCQDWTPVVMSKTRPATAYKDAAAAAARPTLASMTATKNSASAIVAATTAKSASTGTDADDAKKTKYVVKATSDTIRQARCEKKLTQKELAQKCNMDVSIIAEIERGGNCVYNATHVNKIQSVLGVKIPRA